MKTLLSILCLVITTSLFAQQPYYSDVNLTLTGEALYNELQNKISVSNSSFDYGDVRDTVKITDQDPANSQNVLLIYGFNDASCTTQRSRNKDEFGGSTCDYNREHVFARSNANPSMGDANNSLTGIVADPHNLRPSDQQMNGNRGNKKFADGSGNAGSGANNTWYPGDEWKGDVARMMMYMYTRYGNRCLPSLNGSGPLQSGNNMLQIYLQWNVEDPVDPAFEDQRNAHLENVYGNRNPFIDNPYLATLIWGGTPAEDRWDTFGVNDLNASSFIVYPNPTSNSIWVTNTTNIEPMLVSLYSITGKQILTNSNITNQQSIDVSSLSSGLYLLKINTASGSVTKKITIK